MSTRNDMKRKLARRLRRRQHIRESVYGTAATPRMTVYRSHQNIYCQLVDDQRGITLTSASTLGKEAKGLVSGHPGNCKAAAEVGKLIAEKAKALGIGSVQFDRNGYKFHGRVKALVEAARKAGLKV